MDGMTSAPPLFILDFQRESDNESPCKVSWISKFKMSISPCRIPYYAFKQGARGQGGHRVKLVYISGVSKLPSPGAQIIGLGAHQSLVGAVRKL